MGFNEFLAAGVELGFYGTLDTDGLLKGGGKLAPAAGAAAGSPMARLLGVQTADIAIPEPDQVNIPGDNTVLGSFLFPSEDTPAFTVEQGLFSLVQASVEQNTKLFDEGDTRHSVLAPTTFNPEDMCWILQSPTKKKDIGFNGLKAWSGYVIPRSNAQPTGRNSFATRAGASDRHRVITNPADMLPTGALINKTNFGTDGACVIPFTNDYPIYYQRWTGDGTEDTFELAYPAAVYSAAQVIVYVDGVKQTWTTHYTAAAGEIIFVTEPANGAVIVAHIGFDPNA